MSKRHKSDAPETEQSPDEPELSQNAVAFLTQECERLLGLYTQAQSSAQGVFNFYLTFLTTVVGGVVIIMQLGSADPQRTQLVLAGLLFFSVIVGSVYLSALSGRYAHAARYAYGVDELRRFLIARLQIPMPDAYQPFLSPPANPDRVRFRRTWSLAIWLSPTGTYEMFMAFVNSASLALVVMFVFASAGAGAARTLIAAAVVFVIALAVYNVYSRLVIRQFGSRLNVDLANDLPAWAATE